MSKALKAESLVEKQLRLAESKLLAISPVDDLTAKRALAVMTTLAKGVLAECDVTSVLLAALNVAKLGLNPDPQLGHVYLIPFKDTKAKLTRATLIIGYKGFLELARRAGMGAVRVEPVYANDQFVYVGGLHVTLSHVPWWMRTDKRQSESGEFRAAYVVANINGDAQVAVYPVSQLDKAKQHSAAGRRGYGPWVEHEDPMRLKTAVRLASKLWSLSPELGRAVEIDERAEEGTTQELPGDMGEILDAEEIPEGKHGFGRLEMPETEKGKSDEQPQQSDA